MDEVRHRGYYMSHVELVPVAQIAVPKTRTCPKKVRAHVASIEAGEEAYPIDLLRTETRFTVAGNGRHRLLAYIQAGFTSIPAVIR